GVQQPSPSASTDTGAASPMDNDQIASQAANPTVGAPSPGTQQPAPQANATTGTRTTVPTDNSTANGSVTKPDTTGATATMAATDPGVQQPQNQDMSSTAGTNGSGGSSSTMPSGTVTETSRGGALNTPPSNRVEALTALKKAQLYANAGEEDACMS